VFVLVLVLVHVLVLEIGEGRNDVPDAGIVAIAVVVAVSSRYHSLG